MTAFAQADKTDKAKRARERKRLDMAIGLSGGVDGRATSTGCFATMPFANRARRKLAAKITWPNKHAVRLFWKPRHRNAAQLSKYGRNATAPRGKS